MRIVTFFLFFSIQILHGQTLKLGQWYSLQNWRSGYDVTASANNIIFNTGTGLLFFDKSDYSNYRTMTTIDGLSEAAIQRITYNKVANVLFIYYKSGNIDILDGDMQITNFRDIENNNVLVPDKELNDIISADRFIYLCFPFGMVEFDAVERIFANTVVVPKGVETMASSGQQLLLINSGKLYSIDRQQKPNISYFGNWNEVANPQSDTSGNKVFSGLTFFNGNFFTTYDLKLYRIEPGLSFTKMDTLKSLSSVKYINSGAGHLMIGGRCAAGDCNHLTVYNKDMNELLFNKAYVDDHRFSIESENRIWMADGFQAFRYIDLTDLTAKAIDLNSKSPWSNNVVSLLKIPGSLYIAPGGYTNIYQGLGNTEGIFVYDGNEWKIYNEFTDPFFAFPEKLRDFSSLAYNEKTGEVAVGSYWNGLLVINGDVKKMYNESNSALRRLEGDQNNPRVGDVAYDSHGNLWTANVLSKTPVVVFDPEKRSYAFSNPFNATRLTRVTIDPVNEYKWYVEPGKGIYVYDSGDDITKASDDRWAFVPVYSELENQNILPKTIFSDKDGRIWIGTVSGVFVADCGSSVFDPDYECKTRFPYVQDEQGLGPLLYGQTINAIEEDGAGRKWFGTNNGIFVTNSTGDELLIKWTPDNSPLADADIQALEIEKATGNVYVGTKNGVQVFRSDAITGNVYHNKELVIQPNPVRPEYNGPILIKGLAQDSNVKIADINGRLVFETESLGGQAIWYGKDLQGREVASGVYLVLGTTTSSLENPTTVIGKIIYIK